jgi:hypothetical protein
MCNIINISQYDVGVRSFHFIPYTTEGDLAYQEGCAVTLEATKPDRSAIIHNCTYNSDGSIDYTLQEQLAAVAGRVWSKLVLRDTLGGILGTAAIVWVVDRAGVTDGAEMSDSDISAVQEFVQEFGSINAYGAALHGLMAAYGGPLTANAAAGMTDQTKVYVYTGTTTSALTKGHWYYYDGSSWADGGVYQAAAVQTDTTLTVAGEAADAKATGDEITELKNDYIGNLSGVSKVFADMTPLCMHSDGYIWTNRSIGQSISSLDPLSYAGVSCCVTECTPGDVYTINATGATGYRAYCVIDAQGVIIDIAPANGSYTNLQYTIPENGNRLIINDDSGRMSFKGTNALLVYQGALTADPIAVGVRPGFYSFQASSGDTWLPEDFTVGHYGIIYLYLWAKNNQYFWVWDINNGDLWFRIGSKYTKYARYKSIEELAESVADLKSDYSNTQRAVFGGESRFEFEQGSANFTSGYYTPTENNNCVRNKDQILCPLKRGDTLVVSDGYELLKVRCRYTEDGIIRLSKNDVYRTGTILVDETGLYVFLFRKKPSAATTPEDAYASLKLIYNTSKEKTSAYPELNKNPYPTEFSYYTEIISTTHCHCETDAELANLASNYDHVAISNYYPSVTWYPLNDFYTTVPNGFMSSPNAEQVRFSDMAGGVHICGVGSYLCRESPKHDGTIYECIRDIIANSQFANMGGITINHPTYSNLSGDDVLNLINESDGIFALEIYNATCEASYQNGYGLDQWDYVLSQGVQVFGTAVPDHEVQFHPDEERTGLGYCHVLVRAKTEQQILNAYTQGRFYCSIYNDSLKFNNIKFTSDDGLVVETSQSCTIKIITASGVVQTITGTSATYTPTSQDIYVRVEATDGHNTLYSNAVMLI